MPKEKDKKKEWLLLPGEAELERAKRAAQRVAPYNPSPKVRTITQRAPKPTRQPTAKPTKADSKRGAFSRAFEQKKRTPNKAVQELKEKRIQWAKEKEEKAKRRGKK